MVLTAQIPFNTSVADAKQACPSQCRNHKLIANNQTIRRADARAIHRVRLCYRDEAYRQRAEERTKNLIVDASSPTNSSTSVLLAKKALKYRKVYDRITNVNVNDPKFDVFEFLGVDWCKSTTTNPSGYV